MLIAHEDHAARNAGIREQRGIVDMETLAKANQDLIDTVTGVLRVQEEGRKKRAQAEQQMEQLTIDLKKAMTQA